MARLLLLVPSTSYRVGDFLSAARRLEVEVAVGSDRRQVLERYSDGGTMTVGFRDPERAVKRIADYAARHPLAAIVGVDDPTVTVAAHAAAALGLPHNPPDAVARARDKHRFRQALAAAGLPGPGFRLVGLTERSAAAEVGYPRVLKPLALSASRGVIRADDPAEFAAALDRITAILDATPGLPAEAARSVLVEDFLPGPEVAVEGLLTGGRLTVLALFDKPDPMDGPFFEETLFVTPSRHPPDVQAAIGETVQAAVAAIGLHEGPVHAELRIVDGRPVMLELAPRTIGGLCARTLRFGTGATLEEIVIRQALGLPLGDTRRESAAAGVMMIPIPRAGLFRGIEGEIAARAVPGIVDLAVTHPRGQPVVPLPEGDRYLSFIFARGADPAGVEAALRDAHARLTIEID